MNRDQFGEKNPFFNKNHTEEVKDKIRKAHLQEKNPNWKGGTSVAFYSRLARENLVQKCCICNSIDKLEIHHKNKDRKDNRLENIIILCKSCHSKAHNRLKNIKNKEKTE
jgi:5-methylcytosine-specific restriction endonuclease McrA